MPSLRLQLAVLLVMLVISPIAHSDETLPERRRAKLPTWDEIPPGIFFEDAFSEGLRGKRPDRLGDKSTDSADQPIEQDSSPLASGATWSELISAATIEDELKRIKRLMDVTLQNEGFFKSQGYRELRVHLETAAILFAIIEQFDGQVRWKSDAVRARNHFVRLAQNAKVGSTAVYREALQRQRDLSDLIQGAQLSATDNVSPLAWPEVADRSLIMQRLDLAVETSLALGLSANELTQQRDTLLSECEMTDALAEVLIQEGMTDAEDAQYDELCQRLQAAARELKRSVEQNDPQAARRAHGRMKNSCVLCHDLFRD